MINQAYGIAVCDDQETDRERTRIMAEEICRKEKIPGEISCFSRAKDLLEQLKEGRHFDLLLLDVMMPEQDGIALSRRIREEDRKRQRSHTSCREKYGRRVAASSFSRLKTSAA